MFALFYLLRLYAGQGVPEPVPQFVCAPQAVTRASLQSIGRASVQALGRSSVLASSRLSLQSVSRPSPQSSECCE